MLYRVNKERMLAFIRAHAALVDLVPRMDPGMEGPDAGEVLKSLEMMALSCFSEKEFSLLRRVLPDLDI